MAQADAREYKIHARSTDDFGRVLCSCRNHHFIADGPVQNGCPGEAISPAELFLSGVAVCGVELVQVLAKSEAVPLKAISVDISGVMDRSRPPRPDVSLFNSVRLRFRMIGVTEQQGKKLLDAIKADGRHSPDVSVVEYTSGSTGVSLSLVCAVKGYPLHIVSSDAFSAEKLDYMRILGARLEILPSDSGGMTEKLTRDMIEAA